MANLDRYKEFKKLCEDYQRQKVGWEKDRYYEHSEQMKKMVQDRLAEYQKAENIQSKLDRFKRTHPDFEKYKPIILKLINKYPFLDNPDALDLLYKIAKQGIQFDENETLDEIVGVEV